MNKHLFLAAACSMGLLAPASAQKHFGVSSSNTSGLYQLYMNPANAGGTRHKLAFELFSVNAYANNSASKVKFNDLIRDFRNDADNFSLSNYLDWNRPGQISLQMPFFELRGPGIMYAINDKHTIGLTTRARLFSQVNDMDSRMAGLLVEGSNFRPNQRYGVNDPNGFGFTSHLFTDIGLSWGGQILDVGRHAINVGVTARYYQGLGYFNLNSPILMGEYDGATQTIDVDNMSMQFSANDANLEERLQNMTNVTSFFDYLFGNAAGKGFGGDVGISYEFRPNIEKYMYEMDGRTDRLDPTRNKYRLRLGASVLDIGRMRYNNASQYTATGAGTIVIDSLAGKVQNVEDLEQELRTRGFNLTTNRNMTYNVALPTTLLLQADYNFGAGFYLNATYMQNLANRVAPGNFYSNQFTLTPRFESKYVDIGVPFSYNAMSKDVKAGLGVRILFLTVGTDDALAVVSNDSKGFNLYFGAHVPINKKKPKDSDGDLISDRKDKCPFEKGIYEMQGCPNPDKDGDGIPDNEDLCPDVFGSKTAQGCPDADLDSLADAVDRCPTEWGPVALQGCPDRDGDGVADIDDACPDVAGLPEYNGCPDTDGDGVPDHLDKCPDKPGPVANEGCPDTDNDGVPDHLDKCPTVPGTVANHGCPEIRAEVKKRLAFAATAIQFETGKAVIRSNSFKLLDEIVDILNEYKDYYMTIDGHTDAVGRDDFNMGLSKDRANSVRDYFIGKGINPDRLVAEGYGKTSPVATNNTAAGRAKNRRVEMDLKLK